MAEFLPNGSLYAFLGVAGVLFAMTLGCFGYYIGRAYCLKRPDLNDLPGGSSFKRRTRRNKFLMKRGERADKDDENGVKESKADKSKADIDAKYNNMIWSTEMHTA